MTERSPARQLFLADVLRKYAEGGAALSEVVYLATQATHSDGQGGKEYEWVTAVYQGQEPHKSFRIDLDVIARAFELLARGPVESCGEAYRTRLLSAVWKDDAGKIDTVDAANIAEIGLFGKIVYG